jgi:hypothetical protein
VKNTVIITLVLAILAAGIVGLMLVFGFLDAGDAGPILLKTVGAFAILAVCAIAISALMSGKSKPQD